MSVFHNLYTSEVAKLDDKIKHEHFITDFEFLDIYMTTLVNTFKWNNLPSYMPRFLHEQMLQETGLTARFNDDEGNARIYPAFPAGELLPNGQYSRYTIISCNGKTWIRNLEDIELCYNNCNRMPYWYTVKFFAEKSSYALRAVDAGLQKASISDVIGCTSPEQLATINDMNDKDKNMKPFLGVLLKKLEAGELQKITAFDNRAQDILALWDVYVRYRNLFYSTFGINNVEIQKRERLTEAEGSGNDEIVRYTLLWDMLENRRDFCERCRNHFGDDFSVELNRDITTVYELGLDNEEKIEQAEIEVTKGANIATTSPTEEVDKEEKKDEV